MEKVHFKISGDFITNHARNLIIEGRWEDGLHLLKDCVIGVDYETAVSILSGEKKFEGINTLQLEDENSQTRTEWEEKIKWCFCGIVKRGSEYWRPYAYVDNWCAEDLNRQTMMTNKHHNHSYDGGTTLTKNTVEFNEWAIARNNYYMDDRVNDLATWTEINKNSVAVLWKQVRVVPPWIETHRDWQPAIDEFIQLRWLNHRGGHTAKESKTDTQTDTQTAQETFEDEQEQRYQNEYAQVANRIHVHSLDTTNGWLSPEGVLIPCKYMEHDFFALVILKEIYGIDDTHSIRGDVLVNRKWVKLQDKMWSKLYKVDFQVTQSQYDTIWDYCQKHKLTMLKEIEVQ